MHRPNYEIYDIQTDYLGVETHNDQLIIYNFADFFDYLELIFKQKDINYDEDEFNDLKILIFKNKANFFEKNPEIKCVYKYLKGIVSRAIKFDNTLNFETIDEEDKYIEEFGGEYSLEDISTPVSLNTVFQFKNYIIHVVFGRQGRTLKDFYLIIDIPRFQCSTIIPGVEVSNYCRDGLENVAWILTCFEHTFKEELLSANIVTRPLNKNFTLGIMINRLETKIEQKKRELENRYWRFEVNQVNKEINNVNGNYEVSEFIQQNIRKLKELRDKLAHEVNISGEGLQELVELFELCFFNITNLCNCVKSFLERP